MYNEYIKYSLSISVKFFYYNCSFKIHNDSTGAFFIYISKAFDMVNHHLLDKWYSLGLTKNALLFGLVWFKVFLKVLPWDLYFFLFWLTFNLPQICLNCSVHLYADDTIIYITNSQNPFSDFNSICLYWIRSHVEWCLVHINVVVLFNLIWILLLMMVYFLIMLIHLNILGLWNDHELTFMPQIDYIFNRTWLCLLNVHLIVLHFKLWNNYFSFFEIYYFPLLR